MDQSPDKCLSIDEDSITTERLTKIRQIHSVNLTSEKKQEATIKFNQSIEESIVAPATHNFLRNWTKNAEDLLITSFNPASSIISKDKSQDTQPTPHFHHKAIQPKPQTSSELLPADRINMSTLIFDEIHKNKCYSDLLIQRFQGQDFVDKENHDSNQPFDRAFDASYQKSKPYSHFQHISRADLEKYNKSSTSSGTPRQFNEKTQLSILKEQIESEFFTLKEKVLELQSANTKLKKEISRIEAKKDRCANMQANVRTMMGVLFFIGNEGFEHFMMVNALARANTLNPEVRKLKEEILRLEKMKERMLFRKVGP
jgi:hypothetical protein